MQELDWKMEAGEKEKYYGFLKRSGEKETSEIESNWKRSEKWLPEAKSFPLFCCYFSELPHF